MLWQISRASNQTLLANTGPNLKLPMARGMFQLTCLLCLLVFVTASTEQDYKTKSYNNLEYKGTEKGSEDSQVYVYPAGFKGGRYYYGGVYRGKICPIFRKKPTTVNLLLM